MTINEKVKWLNDMAAKLDAGEFEADDVAEDWQREALESACATDGDELHMAYPSMLRDQADELEESAERMIFTTVGEYRRTTPECTGDIEDGNGDIMPDDAEITVLGNEYCVGHYDGNQTFFSLV